MAVTGATSHARKQQALNHIQEHRLPEAKELLAALCRSEPRDTEAWYLLGAINGQLGLFDEAITCSNKAIALQPDCVDAHYNLGQACVHVGRFSDAGAAYRKVLEYNPGHADARYNLGYVLEQQGDYEAALACYRELIRRQPDYVKTYTNLGNLLININQDSCNEGIKYLRLAVRIQPDYDEGRRYLGKGLRLTGRLDEAMEQFNLLIAKDPHNIKAIGEKAGLLEQQGEFDAALSFIEPVLQTGDVNVALSFSAVAPHFDRIDEALQVLESVLKNSHPRRAEARPLHFAAGRLLDKAGDFHRAFGHFKKANALKRIDYRLDSELEQFDVIAGFFSSERLAALPRASNRSQLPVFIVGMPRSGTTLAEQILDSHPRMFGAGELTWVPEADNTLCRGTHKGKTSPHYLEDITGAMLDAAANPLLERLQALDPGALRVVDKMPHNFRFLGLIELLFPDARIIHCTRHPLDTCLSIYTYDFNAMHGYSTDLEMLGRYYLKYRSLVEHWKQVLRIPVLELPYEDMVTDHEKMTRRLVEFCELPWDDQCLAFHENTRNARTISYDQVRRPIYTHSVGRWRHYDDHLAPLKQVLGMTRVGPGHGK